MLNLANMDAESGREAKAIEAYDSLVKNHPEDTDAWESRAYLNLRLGRPRLALNDLEVLLEQRKDQAKQGELRSARTIALLLLRRNQEAVAEADITRKLFPHPSTARLWQRSLLAAGRYDELELDRPEEVLLFPVVGAWLTADLNAAAQALERAPRGSVAQTYRTHLNRAVLLSALGKHRAALEAVEQARALGTLSPQLHLMRARVLHQAGARKQAQSAIEDGRCLAPEDPGLLELQGVLLTESGRPEEALACLDQAISRAPHHFAFLHRATAEMVLGANEEALRDWSLALQRDPELPRAYLGRARCYLRMSILDRALADLEQAAAWAHHDIPLQLEILFTYLRSLPERPENRLRCRLLLECALRQACELLKPGPASASFVAGQPQ
jgi:tetratricopeptide (TPR) repeat protein